MPLVCLVGDPACTGSIASTDQSIVTIEGILVSTDMDPLVGHVVGIVPHGGTTIAINQSFVTIEGQNITVDGDPTSCGGNCSAATLSALKLPISIA